MVAMSLRLYGLNWDQGNHLHPDERFLTMVTNDIKLPRSIIQYFDNSTSPLNPYNYPNYQFFVYGTFPVFLTKLVAVSLHLDSYDQIVLVGRVLSAVFDSLNVFLLYLLSKKLLKNQKIIFLASLLYAFCVLPIQLSHFFAVDTFLNTFLLATFVLMAYGLFLPAAVVFGLALSCKISALYFVPIIILFLFNYFIKSKNILRPLLVTSFSLLISFLVFRIFQPYIFDGFFQVNSHFIDNLNTLKSFSKIDSNFPPAVQWLSISPLSFALRNMIVWGLGLPLSIAFLSVLIINYKKIVKNYIATLIAVWILFLFIYQGSQFNPTMRYLLPIYPFVILLFVILFSYLKRQQIILILILFHSLYSLFFLNIYSHLHTRVDASTWIYKNIPSGSSLTNEYWDDPLPLNISPYSSSIYNGIMISPYDPDSSEKIKKLNSQISSSDYIFMSSNRLWRSIPSVPKIYPLTSAYYNDLFSEKIGFKKLLEVNSYPGFTLSFVESCFYFGPTNYPGIKNSWFEVDRDCLYPGVYLRDDTAEEAFTVYDHPKVLIFSRIGQ